MAGADEILDGLNEVHGLEKPNDVGMGEWIWGACRVTLIPSAQLVR